MGTIMFFEKFKNIDLKKQILFFKNNIIKSKKYCIIYIFLVLILFTSKLSSSNFKNPESEIIVCFLVILLGIFLIGFYSGHHNNKNIHKNAFIIILIFGVMFSFLTPAIMVPDENEHLARTEITSRGILYPQPVNNQFQTIRSTIDIINGTLVNGNIIPSDNITVFNIDSYNTPLNYSMENYSSIFAQNPFYGYLMPAIGMLIAKFFDLTTIWLLWMGRLFNVLLYASLVTVAIKKTPILKVPMIAFSCIPLAVFLCGSVSIDAFINGMGILGIAYFFYLYKTPHLNKKHILKFSAIILLLGTCKVTYFALIFLLILIPKDNFEEKNKYLYSVLSIITIGIIAILWSKFYSTPGFLQSYRMDLWVINHINSTEQINYLIANKKDGLIMLLQTPKYIVKNLNLNYDMSGDNIHLLFLGAIIFLYPKSEELIKTRIGVLLICIIIYVGTYFTLLLTWTPIGQLNDILGVQPRYFIPLFTLLPFIFGFNNTEGNREKIDSYIIMMTIMFLSVTILERIILSY